jgi:cysteine desulfurase
LSAELAEEATLVSVMGVNNETGLIQPSPFLTSHIQSKKPSPRNTVQALHSDQVAGWGKADIDLSNPEAPDLVAIAGHKLGGISGIGALIYRKEIGLEPLLRGNQQDGLRGGTENLMGIRSLLALAEEWNRIREEIEALRPLRDEFESGLRARFPKATVTGAEQPRAPHLSHFVFRGYPKALPLVAQLDLRGFAVSSGSACASAVPEPSHVLLALGLPKTDAVNALRVSLYPGTTREDLTGLLDALESILKRYETV